MCEIAHCESPTVQRLGANAGYGDFELASVVRNNLEEIPLKCLGVFRNQVARRGGTIPELWQGKNAKRGEGA